MSGKSYTFKQIQRLIKAGESKKIELKIRTPSEEIVAKELAALANTAGGLFVIGVAPDGAVVGELAEEAARSKERIQRVASALIPDRIEQVTNVVSGNGKALTVAEVRAPSQEDAPVLTPTGEFYRREGGSIVRKEPELASFIKGLVGQKPKAASQIKVFVAMSFRTEEEPALADYYEAMKRAARCSSPSIVLERIDQMEGDYEISQEVMNRIDCADVVLADYTLSPHNVYYEVGYARGKSKKVIQTARKGTILEFDVRNWRTLFYRNATELEKLLTASFKELLAISSETLR
jgi:predicted HTH transcriptional regulator